ncbi:MAG: sigma-70 family RNA polymerase sigma factor [Gemmataceae bacterium]
MDITSVSLLERLRRTPDPAAWQRLIDLYEPFVRGCLGRDPALANDADDLTQDVMAALVRELPRFERQRDGSFRAWLRTVAANRVRQWGRDRRPAIGPDALADVPDPSAGLSARWDADHDCHVLRRLLELIEPEFSRPVWQAFRRLALDGASAAEVAVELGTTENAVLLSKSRVLRRLREEAAGLVD